MVSEATALPTEPQPLPTAYVNVPYIFVIQNLTWKRKSKHAFGFVNTYF